MTHTPWEIEEDDYGDELWFGGEGCGLITVNGWSNGGSKRDPEAWAKLQDEARLIAAAPDLLEALKVMVRDMQAVNAGGQYGIELEPALHQAHAAIARATGDTK